MQTAQPERPAHERSDPVSWLPVDRLLLDAARSGTYNVSSLAVDSLVRRGGPEAVKVISELYKDGPTTTRNSAAYALAQLGGDQARQVLIDSIQGKGDSSQAIWALGQMKDPQAMGALSSLLDNKSVEESTRREAVQALVSAGRTEEVLRAASHPDKVVSVAALENLGNLGGKEAERILLSSISSADEKTQSAALRALGQLGTPKAVDAMINSLSDKKLQNQVAGQLASIGGKKASGALINAYQRGDTESRRTILQNLSYQPGPETRRLFMSALNERDDQLVTAAASALARMGDSATNTHLMAMMQSSATSKEVRYGIASSLKWGDQKAYRQNQAQIDQAFEAGPN